MRFDKKKINKCSFELKNSFEIVVGKILKTKRLANFNL